MSPLMIAWLGGFASAGLTFAAFRYTAEWWHQRQRTRRRIHRRLLDEPPVALDLDDPAQRQRLEEWLRK